MHAHASVMFISMGAAARRGRPACCGGRHHHPAWFQQPHMHSQPIARLAAVTRARPPATTLHFSSLIVPHICVCACVWQTAGCTQLVVFLVWVNARHLRLCWSKDGRLLFAYLLLHYVKTACMQAITPATQPIPASLPRDDSAANSFRCKRTITTRSSNAGPWHKHQMAVQAVLHHVSSITLSRQAHTPCSGTTCHSSSITRGCIKAPCLAPLCGLAARPHCRHPPGHAAAAAAPHSPRPQHHRCEPHTLASRVSPRGRSAHAAAAGRRS